MPTSVPHQEPAPGKKRRLPSRVALLLLLMASGPAWETIARKFSGYPELAFPPPTPDDLMPGPLGHVPFGMWLGLCAIFVLTYVLLSLSGMLALAAHRTYGVNERPQLALPWLAAAVVLRGIAFAPPLRGTLLVPGAIAATWACAACGCLGPGGLRRIWSQGSVELTTAGLLTAVAAAGFAFRHYGVRILLTVSSLGAATLLRIDGATRYTRTHADGHPDITLHLRRFTTQVAEGCSGWEGFTLFSLLLGVVLIVDAPRWRARQILPAYLGGLATMMALNILRIAALVEIGARYSAQFAVGTFHSNAGWVLVGLGCVAYLNALARFGIGRIEPEEPAPNTAPSP